MGRILSQEESSMEKKMGGCLRREEGGKNTSVKENKIWSVKLNER